MSIICTTNGDLLDLCDAGEWVGNMGEIIDCIIDLMAYDGNKVQSYNLYFARRLQEFFMKLDKATDTIADNCSINPEDIDPTSKQDQYNG